MVCDLKAVIVFSGGLDSVCTSAYLQKKFQIYGITFSYGQKANKEVKVAQQFSELLKFKELRGTPSHNKPQDSSNHNKLQGA